MVRGSEGVWELFYALSRPLYCLTSLEYAPVWAAAAVEKLGFCTFGFLIYFLTVLSTGPTVTTAACSDGTKGKRPIYP